jgi:hypothetical protein
MDPDPVTNSARPKATGMRRYTRAGVMYLVLAAVAAGTFSQTIRYPFVYDDRQIIEQNRVVTEPGRWLAVLTMPYWPREGSLDPLYRPLTTLTLKINYAISQGRPTSFRAVNLALHALATVLVAALARRLWGRNSAAWVAGILFAVHPIHADALGLIVGRAELLAGVFVTGMLWRHLGKKGSEPLPTEDMTAPEHPQKGPDPFFPPSVRYHLSTALLFLLALASKEHAVIAWAGLAMIDLWQRRRMPERESWRGFLQRMATSHHLGLILALAVFLFMRWVVFGGRTTLPPDFVSRFANPLIDAPLAVRLATPWALLGLGVRQWFVTAPLCPIWSVGGFDLPESFWRTDVLLGAAAGSVMLLVLAVGWRRRWRLSLLLGLFVLAVLLPCHFVPAANWLYAERWLYLPSVFLAVLCGGLAKWVPRFSMAGSTAAAALLLTTTVPYQRSWETHEAVFEAVVARQAYSYHGLLGLVAVRYKSGRLGQSAVYVERLTDRFPDSERAWYYQVLLAGELRDWDAAAEALQRWSAIWASRPPSAEILRVAEEVRAHGR